MIGRKNDSSRAWDDSGPDVSEIYRIGLHATRFAFRKKEIPKKTLWRSISEVFVF